MPPILLPPIGHELLPTEGATILLVDVLVSLLRLMKASEKGRQWRLMLSSRNRMWMLLTFRTLLSERKYCWLIGLPLSTLLSRALGRLSDPTLLFVITKYSTLRVSS